MTQLKTGDKVIIRDRKDWPSTPGYVLANAAGEITALQPEEGFITLRLLKTVNTSFVEGTSLVLRIENVEKTE